MAGLYVHDFLLRDFLGCLSVLDNSHMTPWTEQNLLELIANQQEENLELDFKRAAALAKTERDKTEISKDVSAFANTVGGTILYGVQEAPDPPHVAAAIDPVDPRQFSKEWLEQIINSRIHPRLSGILIDPIALPITRAGHVVYRVVVPEGATAHQASDKRYYRRFNFESVAMEDYEIRHAMFRLTRPAYRIFPHPRIHEYPGGGIQCSISVTVLNTTEIPGRDCSLRAYVPAEIYPNAPEYMRVDVLQVPCVRFGGCAASVLAPGSTSLNFDTGLLLQGEHCRPPHPIPMFFRIYDSFGLAMSQRFSFTPTGPRLWFEEDIDVGRKSAVDLP